jgi:hypothetical protein
MELIKMKDKKKANLLKAHKEVRKEYLLWRELREYVKKKMVGKTNTEPLENEISRMIADRLDFMLRLRSDNSSAL